MRWFTVDRGSPLPLIRQIYGELSSQILSGELASGERLPSSREAAVELGVSRNVVLEAYDQLAAEGYVLPVEGAGTFVAAGSCLGEGRGPGSRPGPAAGGIARCERRGPETPDPALEADFLTGRPALDLVPLRTWAGMERDARLAAGSAGLDYAPPEGRIELREALCRFLARKRGIECRPEEVIVTSGALQAVSLVAKAVLRPGSLALVEDPGTLRPGEAFELEGARVEGVPVDEEGLRTDLLPAGDEPALVFATPSHQFPLGGCLSIQRRIELVNYARAKDCLVVEDDYESEFRYDGQPVSSLQRLDPARVAYVGTFSKIFIPALRLGYLVAPEGLAARCADLRRASDRFAPPAPQLAMARFIEEGRLERHVARMKKVYRERRDALADSLREAFGARVRLSGLSTGLHLVAAFEGVDFDADRLGALRRAGLGLYPVEDYARRKGERRGELVMGYSHLEPGRIRRGVAIMKGML